MSATKKNENKVVEAQVVVTAQHPAAPPQKPEAPAPKEVHGHREGTQAALLSREMVRRGTFTVAQVAQSLGLTPGRVKSHAKHLVKRGIATATAEGFQIVKLSAEEALAVQLTAKAARPVAPEAPVQK